VPTSSPRTPTGPSTTGWPGPNRTRCLTSPDCGNRTAFDAAFIHDLDDGRQGVVGIETKYHEHAQKEERPKPERLRRYIEVTEHSHAFTDGAPEFLVETPLQQIWLDHLLALAMLQHPSGRWQRARFVLLHPAANAGFAHLAEQYRELLVDQSTFGVRTIESLLTALPEITTAAFRDRYLWTVN
jgi:hypothetical protein